MACIQQLPLLARRYADELRTRVKYIYNSMNFLYSVSSPTLDGF